MTNIKALDWSANTEECLQWLLDFLALDLDNLRPGDWDNLGADFLKILPSWTVTTGLTHKDLYPTPAIKRGARSPSQIKEAQRQMRAIMEQWEKGQKIRFGPIPAIFESSFVYGPGGRSDQRGLMQATFGKTLVDSLQAEFLWLLHRIDSSRVRHCNRGKEAAHKALGLSLCGRWFYARDFRQRFCSMECGKEIRWARYWKAHREQINKKRRKGG